MNTQLLRALPFALVPLTLAHSAVAQGSDACATPTVITGQGNFGFDSTAATTGAQGQYDCSGSLGIDRDVWFSWAAPASGSATLSTCGGASFDIKVAAYAGGDCPSSPPLACNDDSCGLQSVITFPVTALSTYMLQIGSWPSAPGGAGTFSLTVGPPPPPCGASTGPDVVIGDLNSILNTSTSGGVDALALGTTACNVGTQIVNWVGPTNAHPVIRQNLYRYKLVGGAGRFEQVGRSWVKHGFGAAQDSYCCTCQGNGDAQHLGVGCSDPYDASTNGTQSILGPNWQVNSHTGVFPYPPADPPHGSDAVYRRCQVALSDLEVTGGSSTTRYFGEGHFVTADDAQAGNGNNNASWCELNVTGGPSDFDFGFASTTHQGQPAIYSWGQVEAGVDLVELQVQGDGLLVLGARATDLGGGQWRYEYAVYNMNCDRNVGSFTVPVAASVDITNIGFHDVSYHDGDGPGNVNISSADWPANRIGNELTWSTQTEAQNASANAIRWGSLYNFRFDANAAPQSGTMTLGLWKSGSPPAITATGDVPGGGGPIAIESFCHGDGSIGPCPCGNTGTPGRGCENSASTGGARLSATGNPSLSADTLVLTSIGERPTSLSLFLQGDLEIAPVFFGDGLRCTGGNLKRLYTKTAVGGSAIAPSGADLSVSARSAALGDSIPSMALRYYLVHYRDGNATFCPSPAGSTFNGSNGLRVLWGP
ncbi:MAG: hypothetical protein ACKVXR_13875 [Planctomycetota bacterium]